MERGTRTVAVLGGGIAGLSVAHELAKRPDYKVTVFEARGTQAADLGGKARSFRRETDSGDILFGEHGFRFFPGFYRNVIATMGEIPRDDGRTVEQLLRPLEEAAFYAERTKNGLKRRILPAFAGGFAKVGGVLFLLWLLAAGFLWWRAASPWWWLAWLVAPLVWVALRAVVIALADRGDAHLVVHLPSTRRTGKNGLQRFVLPRHRSIRWIGVAIPVAAFFLAEDPWRILPLALALGACIWWYPALATVHHLWGVLSSIPIGVRPGVFESVAATFRIGAVITSSPRRVYEQWENENWWSYIGAYRYSSAFRLAFATGLTRAFVATRAEQMSARTGATILAQLLYDISPTLCSRSDPADRVLSLPTHEAWIDPWVEHLRAQGVRFNAFDLPDGSTRDVPSAKVTKLLVDSRGDGGERPRIVGFCYVETPGGDAITSPQDFDHYVLAVSGTSAQQILANSPDVIRTDRETTDRPPDELGMPFRDRHVPHLDGIFDLQFGWMTGIVYHLEDKVDLPKGHLLCLESDWALTAIEQARTWDTEAGSWGSIISVNISDWFTPSAHALPASFEGLDAVATETWRQLREHVPELDGIELTPANIPDSALRDPDLAVLPAGAPSRAGLDVPVAAIENQSLTNDEKLLINTAGSWARRPTARTVFANLVLAGDYVRTWTDFASMEGANEAARRAANVILERDGLPADVDVLPLPVPKELSFPQQLVRSVDRFMMWASLPHPFLVLATPIGWFAGAEIALHRTVLRLRARRAHPCHAGRAASDGGHDLAGHSFHRRPTP